MTSRQNSGENFTGPHKFLTLNWGKNLVMKSQTKVYFLHKYCCSVKIKQEI